MDTKKTGQLSYEEFAMCLTKTTDTDLRTQIMLLKMQVEEVRKDQVNNAGAIHETIKEAVQSAIEEYSSGTKPEKKLDPPQAAPGNGPGGVQLEPKANQAKTEELL